MFNSNPNQRNNPYAPQQSWMSKQTNGSRNPYGFGSQRLAGQIALQSNVSGMPTNTVPMPQRTRPAQPTLQNWMQQGMQRFQQNMAGRQPQAPTPYRPPRPSLGGY
jgi:hypothetical protein